MIRLGIDMDGVVADFTTPYVQKLNEMQGTNIIVPTDAIREWHFEQSVGFTHETVEGFWAWANTPEAGMWWETMPQLCTDAEMAYILSLAESEQFDPVFITKCPMLHRKARQNWVLERCYGLPIPVIASNRKGAVAYGMDLHAFVDDKPQNLVDIRRSCGIATDCYLLDQPWNRDFDDPYIERVVGLKKVLDKMTEKVYNRK